MANLYVIRFKNKKESSPLSELDVKDLILKGEVKEDDEISIHPNQFSIKAKSYPEFELFFEDEDKTSMIDLKQNKDQVHEDKTSIFDPNSLSKDLPEQKVPNEFEESPDIHDSYKKQKTMIFERPKEFLGAEEKKREVKRYLRNHF